MLGSSAYEMKARPAWIEESKGLRSGEMEREDLMVEIILRAHARAINPLTEEAGYLQETYVCPWGG